jgi:glucokinase
MDLVADMGGTRIKLGLAEAGRLLDETIIPSDSQNGFMQAWRRMVEAWKGLTAARGLDPRSCRGVAVGFPSMVDQRSRKVHNHFGKYMDAPEMDIPALAEAAFGIPFFLENDARMAAMGEWRFGAGRGCNNLAMFTLGTGVGTSVIADGKVLRGRGQMGGHGGHTVVLADGHRCVCGQIGCIEGETGSRLLPQICREQEGFASSSLAALDLIDYKAVFRHADAGDAVALRVRDRAINLWAVLCTNVCHWFDIELIVIGGGIMKDAHIILPRIQAYLDEHCDIPGKVLVVAAQDEDHMGLLGAHALIDEQLSP